MAASSADLFFDRLRQAAQDFDQITDFPAHRAKREELQRSALATPYFGAVPASVEEVEAEVAGRRALVHRPFAASTTLPMVVNFHGGGWVQGNPELVRWSASEIAARVGAVVVSPTYRLAPEHPYPAAVEDAWSALTWAATHADDLGGDPQRIAVMGDSAGGNLAAAVAVRARDEGFPALRAQVLNYPVTDMYEIYPSEIEHAPAPMLTAHNLRALVRIYLDDHYGTRAPDASPMRARSHASLPPTLIVTAGVDVLRDHGTRYADVLQRAGTPVWRSEHPRGVHGFLSLPGVAPEAQIALRDIVGHLDTWL